MKKGVARVQKLESSELVFSLESLRQFLNYAFDHDFTDSDFANTLGGVHFIVEQNAQLVAHGAVVKRPVLLDGVLIEVSYVEAVAVAKKYRGLGYGEMVMDAVSQHCLENTRVSLLSSEEQEFYSRFGWSPLAARSFAMTPDGLVATTSEDDCLMILAKPPHLSDFGTIVALDRPTCPW